MIVAIDVQYNGNIAKAVAGIFEDWTSNVFYKTYSIIIDDVANYESGSFYKRELPCILKLLAEIKENYDYIIIDGYVFLGNQNNSGLGKHLWDVLILKKPIIGVAKNYFKDTPDECFLFRGESRKPLFITSIGIPLDEAKNAILNMHGKHRIPYLLKCVDLSSRESFTQ